MKYIIVGLHGSGKQEVMDTLEKAGIDCGHLFTNADLADDRYEFFTDNDIRTIFENKSYVFIKELDTDSRIRCFEGLSFYEFDNKSVFALSPDQFTAIPAASRRDEVCFIWMDNTLGNRVARYKEERRSYDWSVQEKLEKSALPEFIKGIYTFPNSHLLYFYNEDPQRVAAIVYALVKHEDLLPFFEKKFN